MYIARLRTDASLEDIGFVFNKYHATVLHNVEMVKKNRRLIMIAKIIIERITNQSFKADAKKPCKYCINHDPKLEVNFCENCGRDLRTT